MNIFQLFYTTGAHITDERFFYSLGAPQENALSWKSLAECVGQKIGAGDTVAIFSLSSNQKIVFAITQEAGFNYYFGKRNAVLLVGDLNQLRALLERYSGGNVWVFFSEEMEYLAGYGEALAFLEDNSIGMPCRGVFVLEAERSN